MNDSLVIKNTSERDVNRKQWIVTCCLTKSHEAVPSIQVRRSCQMPPPSILIKVIGHSDILLALVFCAEYGVYINSHTPYKWICVFTTEISHYVLGIKLQPQVAKPDINVLTSGNRHHTLGFESPKSANEL